MPKDQVALSNMPETSSTATGDGLKSVKFQKTPIMSTYLVAFVVGDLDYIEDTTTEKAGGGKPVVCRVYAPPGLAEQGRFALGVATKTLDLFSDIFGQVYPLPKMDLIAVPDFDAGKVFCSFCVDCSFAIASTKLQILF